MGNFSCMIQSATAAEMLSHIFEALIVGVAGGLLLSVCIPRSRSDEADESGRR